MQNADILHAAFTGRGLELDNTFNCRPGSYGGYQVNALVDIVALRKANSANASVMGIDGNGTLLYCAPGQVPQAFALPPLPSTNWGRVTSIVLDSNWLYILDAPERAVWLFPNSDSTFLSVVPNSARNPFLSLRAVSGSVPRCSWTYCSIRASTTRHSGTAGGYSVMSRSKMNRGAFVITYSNAGVFVKWAT